MSTTEYSREEVENEKNNNNRLGQLEIEGYVRTTQILPSRKKNPSTYGTITKTKKPFSLQAAQI